MARPMPRDAPVTSATLPVSVNMFWSASLSGERLFDRREIVGTPEADDLRSTMDLADQSAQHGTGTHLTIRSDASRRNAFHARTPADRRRTRPDHRPNPAP